MVILFLVGAFSLAGWLWTNLYDVSPQFHFISIEKNGNPLKLLNKEVLYLHPGDKLKILKISSNMLLNRGVRLVADEFDVNALLYERKALSALFPNRDIFNQLKSRVKVKHFNQDLGYVDMVVEPYVEDWLEKADRTIDGNRRIALLERGLILVPDNDKLRDRLIEEYKSLKRWDQAARMLEEKAGQKPEEKVLYDLIEVYEAMAKTDKIISILKRLLKSDPDNVEVRLRLASVLEKSKKIREAIKEYEYILKTVQKEDRLPVYKILGFLYIETGRTDKAISNYLHALELDKKDVNLYYNLSNLYEKMGKRDKADFFLSKAVSLKSEDTESRIKLSERLIKKGKIKEAETYLKEVLKKTPNSITALLLMVTILEKRGDKGQLKKIYNKILLFDPKNKTIIYNLGVLEYETDNLGNSLSYFQRLLTLNPEDKEAHGFLFDIYKKQNKDDLAFKEALVLLKLRPKEISYYHFIFQHLDRLGNYEKMIGIMKNGLTYHPKNIDLRKYLILAYLKTEKEDLATAEMIKALKFRPGDATLLLQLATLKEKHGKFQEATTYYKKLAGIKPKDITVLLKLAELQEKQGEFKEAIRTYGKILDISPGHNKVQKAHLGLLLQLATLQEKQGTFQEAIKTYKQILDVYPDHEEAEEAYLRLRLKGLPVGGKE